MDQKITLGGTEFVVPPLAAWRIIEFSVMIAELGTINPRSMSRQSMQCLYDAVLIGVQQAKPDMTINELMDMPIPLGEAMAAIKVIAKQVGLDFEAVPSVPAANDLTLPASALNGTGSLLTSSPQASDGPGTSA